MSTKRTPEDKGEEEKPRKQLREESSEDESSDDKEEEEEADIEPEMERVREMTSEMQGEMNCQASALLHQVGVIPRKISIEQEGLFIDYGPASVYLHFDGSLSLQTKTKLESPEFDTKIVAKRVVEILNEEI